MVLSICEVCTFFSKLTCNSGALQVMLRVVWGEAFQTVLSPILGCFLSLSVGQNWAASLHSCLHLPGFCSAPISVRDFPPCAFVVSELFQEHIVHGKDCYFRKNQRLGCTITQYKPGCMEQLCVGSCWWLYPDRLRCPGPSPHADGSFPELGPSSPWAAGQHCRGWAVEPVAQRLCLPVAASELFVLCTCEKGACEGRDEKWLCWLQSCWVGSAHLVAKVSTLLSLGCWYNWFGWLIVPQFALPLWELWVGLSTGCLVLPCARLFSSPEKTAF